MLFVWVQTSKHRDPSKALASIEESDIGTDYLLVKDDNDWNNGSAYKRLQAWWGEQWQAAADAAEVAGCPWILRLEDDVEVNRHIKHNVLHWEALKDPNFAYGTLFHRDCWKEGEQYYIDKKTGVAFVKRVFLEGAQGQVVATKHVKDMLGLTQHALRINGDKLSFDCALSGAASMLKLVRCVHLPALVVESEVGIYSSLSSNKNRTPENYSNSGFKMYSERWKHLI